MSRDSGKCPIPVAFLGVCPECDGEVLVHTLYANDEAEATCSVDGEVTLTEFYP